MKRHGCLSERQLTHLRLTPELLISQPLLVTLQVLQQALEGLIVRTRHAVKEERAVEYLHDPRQV